MKLISNLRLQFAKRNNTISITTRTYEKASFDQYLAASIAERCPNIYSAEEYIDSVTGKGSMNAHLKKLYKDMCERSNDERRKILESSLYPIEKIDDSQSFVYFPEFEKSMFNGILYDGDLAEQRELLEQVVPFDGELVSISIRPSETRLHTDNYRVTIDENGALIQLSPNAFLHADPYQFKGMVIQELFVPDVVKNIAIENVEGDGWFLLTASQINGPMKDTKGFYNGKAYYLITNNGIKKTEIGYAFGLFLYKDSLIEFDPKNSSACNLAALHLLSSKEINTFKTKSLVSLLGSAEGDVAQKCINFVLSIKDSRELAHLGLELLDAGLKDGWSARSLFQMKMAANQKQAEAIYAIDSTIFELNDILTMDPNILTLEHRALVEKHKQERQTKITYVQSVLGEVSGSALREKSGKLKNDDEVREFRNLINKILAHSKVSLVDMNDDKLDSAFRLANRLKKLMPIIAQKVKEQEVEQ